MSNKKHPIWVLSENLTFSLFFALTSAIALALRLRRIGTLVGAHNRKILSFLLL